jgi:hypothetical protein
LIGAKLAVFGGGENDDYFILSFLSELLFWLIDLALEPAGDGFLMSILWPELLIN